jgi:two-component system, cell cycle sensor histidine kinase and response regulator CckA
MAAVVTDRTGPEPATLQARLEQVLDILAHISFGHLEMPVPELPEDDDFADLFTGLGVLVADLREAREELEAQVRHRTEELEEDIRKREQVEAQLRAREATYRMLVETSPDPIALCDPNDRVRMVNPAFLRAFCVDSAQAVTGAAWLDFVAIEDRARATECWRGLSGEHAAGTAELTFRRRDGSEFVGELRCSAVRDAAGTGLGVLSVIHDVTEQRQREREQLRAEKLESLGTLAGGIAHDFNNSLAAITGCLSLATGRARHDPEVRDLLVSAMDAAFRATTLTKQLLTFSKGGVPVKACVHVGGLVKRVADFWVRGSNARCEVEVAADLWPVEVDSGQLEQVIGNLVINAKQAMPNGGTVVVRASNVVLTDNQAPSVERRYVCISVHDTGMGIPAENLRRIYDPYFSTKDGGTGLGLATAYSVVRKHEGFIECESALGQGSTFRVHLPASDLEPVSTSAVVRSAPPGRGRILVMDDDDLVRELAAQLLSEAGYETVGVASGAAALSAYEEARAEGKPFAAALMDLTVPGGDGGKETVRKLLAVDPAAKAIVVSGYSDDPVLANYQAYGFAAGLAKPYRLEELLHIVASVTDSES